MLVGSGAMSYLGASAKAEVFSRSWRSRYGTPGGGIEMGWDIMCSMGLLGRIKRVL